MATRMHVQWLNHFAYAREYAEQGNCCGTFVCGLYAYAVLFLSLFLTIIFAADQILYLYIGFYVFTTTDFERNVCGIELKHTPVHTYLIFILTSPLTICYCPFAVIHGQFKGTPFEHHPVWGILVFFLLALGYALSLVPGLFIFYNKGVCDAMVNTQAYQLALLKFRFALIGECFFFSLFLFVLSSFFASPALHLAAQARANSGYGSVEVEIEVESRKEEVKEG